MKKRRIILFLWQILYAISLVGIAVIIRILFFNDLGRGIPYLTFYPAVALATLFGSFASGIIVAISGFFLTYFWIQKGSLSHVEVMAEVVFILSCIIISIIGGVKNGQKIKSQKVEEEVKLKHMEIEEKNRKLLEEIQTRKESENKLNQLNKYMIGRELKMIELKKNINSLIEKQKKQ